MRAMTDDKLHSADRFTRALRSVHAERGPRSSCRMRTEQKPPARSPENTMNQARGESETSRKNGYLPAGVVHVSKEELRRFLKCKRVGNYLLGKNIGEGSFARVKQGFHVLTGERVAVKIIDKKQAQKDKYVAKNMRREAKILQMVCHPNVVQLLEVVETENRYYLVTELAAGGDLMDYICYRRKLGEVEVRKFIRQIVSAVHYLHRGGILHRDLKVENLLLDEDYNIKIIDFGLSNTIYGPTSEGQTMKDHCQTQCGSPAYAAPEILGHKQYGPQVDVWSIGVNMYAMLTGKLPYTAEPFHITTLYNKMKTGDMNEVPEHLSRGCKDLIHKFLTFHPEERITLEEALNHEWLCKEQRPQSTPITFPNYLSEEVMDEDIVNHMVEKMQFKRLETIEAVIHNRPTPASCVYHLLSKKLKKYIEKHPDRDVKIRKAVKVESSPLPSRLPVAKRSQTTSEGSKGKHFNETSNRTTSHEKVVAERVYVEDENQPEVPDCSKLSVNDVEHSEKANSNSSALEVEAFVVFQSSMALSSEKENSIETPRTTIVTPCVEPEKEKSTALETPRTIDGSSCSIASNASEENSRGRANSASCELITINRRKASQNLSQISVETRSTNGPRDPLKNTSISICSERGDSTELLSSGTSSKVSSDRRDDEAPMAEDSLNSSRARSYSCNGTSVPAMVLVEPVNAKVVSIPKSLRRRSESFDQTPHSARMSLPHPKKHSESSTNRPHGGALRNHSSDCAVRQSTSEGKSPPVGISRINRVSVASIAPYGLCCQVIRLSNSDMHSGAEMHDGQRARNRRKTFSLSRRLSGDTARNDTDVENPRQIGRAATQRLSTTTQNGAELSNSLDRSSGSTARAHDQEREQQSLPFKMRLPLTRKSVDAVQEWRRCLRQETNRSRDETTDNRRRKSTGQRTGETGPAENCTVASSRRRNRIGISKGVSLPPAPGASPPDSYSKQITNEVLDLARESPRRRLNREMTTEPKDRRHVPDADYVSRLSQLRRSRQNDKEGRPLVQRGDHEEKDRRRFSEPNARVHSSVSPPLLTSPRGAVIKLTHRPTRGRNQ